MDTTPVIQTNKAAGADLHANEEVVIRPGELKSVSTGYSYHIDDENYVGLIKGRSGLAFKHHILAYNGVVDSDFTGGEVKVLLENKGNTAFHIDKGMRIAQIVVCPVSTWMFYGVSDKERNSEGFGSTGIG